MRRILIIAFLIQLFTAQSQDRFSLVTDWQNGYDWSLQLLRKDSNYVTLDFTTSFSYGFDYVINTISESGVLINQNKLYREQNKKYDYGHLLPIQDKYLFIGSIYDSATQPQNTGTGYLMKLDSNYDTLWSNKYYNNGYQTSLIDAVSLNDRIYIIYGITMTQPAYWETSQLYLMAIDSSGSKLWETSYGNSMKENAIKIIPSHDGNFMLLGWTDRVSSITPTGIAREGYLIKVDSMGNKLWEKIYPWKYFPDATIIFNDIISNQGGNYSIAGWESTQDVSPYDVDGFVYRIDEQGNIIWNKYMSMPNDNIKTYLNSIQELPDGTMIATGERYISNPGNLRGWAVKLSPIGTILWERTYDHYQVDDDNYLSDMQLTPDGGFIACGMTDSLLRPQDGWLLKADCNGCTDSSCTALMDTCSIYNCLTDSLPIAKFKLYSDSLLYADGDTVTFIAGNKLDVSTFNRSEFSAGYEWQLNGSTYSNLVFDTLQFTQSGSYEFTLISSNQNCRDTLSKTIVIDEVLSLPGPVPGSFHLYPNPAQDIVWVEHGLQKGQIQLLDITGKVFLSTPIRSSSTKLSLNEVPKGLYFVRVVNSEGQSVVKKLVIRK